MPRVVHFEIQAEQPERAIAFYSAVFGWQFPEWMDGYWGVVTGAEGEPGIDGGLMPRRGPAPASGAATNAFVCTVQVDDVETYAAKAAAAGGEVVVPRMPIPGVGYSMYCVDTEGNIFGLHQPDPTAE
ncbi:MAG: VOC family protein [Dehalococcoidia bacterium]